MGVKDRSDPTGVTFYYLLALFIVPGLFNIIVETNHFSQMKENFPKGLLRTSLRPLRRLRSFFMIYDISAKLFSMVLTIHTVWSTSVCTNFKQVSNKFTADYLSTVVAWRWLLSLSYRVCTGNRRRSQLTRGRLWNAEISRCCWRRRAESFPAKALWGRVGRSLRENTDQPWVSEATDWVVSSKGCKHACGIKALSEKQDWYEPIMKRAKKIPIFNEFLYEKNLHRSCGPRWIRIQSI